MAPRIIRVGSGGIRIKQTGKYLVVPEVESQLPEHWVCLTNLDRVVNPTFSSVISFYQDALAIHQSVIEVVRVLRSSLAKVLVHFYPLAGRLKIRDEDGKVDLHCNNAGAVFVEAAVDATLAEWGGPQPFPTLSGLELARIGHGSRSVPNPSKPMPVLIIQVTQFKCGAVAIASNWHHSVGDGSSGIHFMKSWAEVATGRHISIKPNHDRYLIQPRNPPNDAEIKHYTSALRSPPADDSDLCATCRYPAVLKRFDLCKAFVQDLKQKVQMEVMEEGNHHGSNFTSVEVISAHLWQTMTRARAHCNSYSSSDSSKCSSSLSNDSRFFMFVDGRKRLGLPPGYFGNVVCSTCASSSEEDILNGSLSYVATLIKEAVHSATGEFFHSLIDWVEMQGSSLALSDHMNSVGHDVAATFWTFFPLYELDFGWGKPVFAGRNSPARPLIDGIAIMPSNQGSGNMVAILNLHSERMSRLEKDPAFQSVYSPNPEN